MSSLSVVFGVFPGVYNALMGKLQRRLEVLVAAAVALCGFAHCLPLSILGR